ncbi:helix-turn-helix domain-containing protein [Kordia sp. SMS9]|uniref:helix-turn-helix domain-containing protein n=1 Tax=Kordia sp. SMS9 TaxID=2282170 RepID=UPI0013B3EB1A|nr:helix-turn-helix domain-containing protein [Kordia sp. SMS9]
MQKYKQHPKKASVCLRYIKDEMLQSEDLLTQFWGNYALAHWHHNQLNFEKSLLYVDKLYKIAVELKDNDLILSSLINRGNFYFKFGNYKESMEFNLEALELAKASNNVKRELAILLNLALIKLETNDNVGAIELLDKILIVINDGTVGELINLKIKVYVALIKGYIKVENYPKARIYCEKTIKLSRDNNYKEYEFYGLSFLGTIERFYENYSKAHELLDESLIIAQEIKTVTTEIPLIYFEKGKVFYKEKKFQKAIHILLKAGTLMQQNKLDFIKLEETYALLAKSYNEIGNTKNSIKYYEKANEAYKKNDERQGSISVDIIKKYDLQSLKEELNKAEQKTEKTRTVLYISAFLGFFVVIGLIYFYKKREKDNQQKFIALLQSLEEEKQKSKVGVQKEVFKKEAPKESISKKKISTELASKEVEIIDETKIKLLKKLQSFEDKEQFLSKNSSLNEVAKKLKTNTSYLSKLVNAHKGKSFTAYITDLRVNYAIRRLKEDKRFRSYTIDSIAREIGFNRSESFSRAFKNKTGLYPSYYIKNLENQNIT